MSMNSELTEQPFRTLVERYTIDAFEYNEYILDFIDSNYDTVYNNCDMNDEIEQLSDAIHHGDDYSLVECIYDLSCIKYPLIKKQQHLNPYLRHINSYRIFNDLFGNMLESIDFHFDEDFDSKIQDIKHKLIISFPACEKLITEMMKCEELDEYDFEMWFIPKDEMMNGQYENLFNELNDIQPGIFHNDDYIQRVSASTKDSIAYESDLINYLHYTYDLSIDTIKKIQAVTNGNHIGFKAINKFYDELCRRFPALVDFTILNPYLRLVNAHNVFASNFEKYIVRPVRDSYPPDKQAAELEKIKRSTLELFPECEKIIIPLFEQSSTSHVDSRFLIPSSIMYSGEYKNFFNWIKNYKLNQVK